jgi:hypothetical protein
MTDPRGEAVNEGPNVLAMQVSALSAIFGAYRSGDASSAEVCGALRTIDLDALLRAAQSATPASDALRLLSEDVMRCIDASWKPGYARDYGNLGPILAEYIDDLRRQALPAAFNAPDGWHPDEPNAPLPATAASDALRRLSEDVMRCIDASWKPGYARDYSNLGPILAEYVGDLRNALRSETPAGGTAKVPEGWKLVPVEPTHPMWSAAIDAYYSIDNADGLRGVLRAAIAAAPSPDGNEEKPHG